MTRRSDPSTRAATLAATELSGVRVPDDERRALANLAEQFSVPPADLGAITLQLSDLDVLPLEIARRHKVLPMLVRGDAVFLAMTDPGDRQAIEEVEFVCGRRVVAFVADAERLAALVDTAYDARARGEDVLPAERPSVAPSLPPHLSVPPAPLPPSTSRQRPSSQRNPAVTAAPAGPTPPAPPAAPTVAPPARASAVPSAAQLVFVVDADTTARESARASLREKGYRAEGFARASTAREAAARERPALIVLDPALPDQHGFDLCAALKPLGDIPVVVVSAELHGWRLAQDLADTLSVRALLRKPVGVADLAAKVGSALAGEDPDAQGALPPAVDAALAASTEAYQRGDLDGAVAAIEQGLLVAPEAWRLRYHLALLLSRKGEVFRALRELEASVETHHRFFPALKNLALLYERAGFRRKAVEAWERALAVAPDAPTRASIKDHLLTLL
ncbi:MAG: response regulator [Polyangiales bacterium]